MALAVLTGEGDCWLIEVAVPVNAWVANVLIDVEMLTDPLVLLI